MNTELLLQQLFPRQLDYQIEGYVIKGSAQTDAGPVRILGTVNAALSLGKCSAKILR